MSSIILNSGRRLSLEVDSFANNPRDYDNVARFICVKNRDFSLDENLSRDELKACYEKAIKRGYYVFKLFVYVHGGLVFSLAPFSCPWDSWQCGIVVVNKSLVKNKDEALGIAKREVDTLNAWLLGYVRCLIVESPTGFCGVADDSLSELYINDEGDLISCLPDLNLTEGELKEAVERVSELMS